MAFTYSWMNTITAPLKAFFGCRMIFSPKKFQSPFFLNTQCFVQQVSEDFYLSIELFTLENNIAVLPLSSPIIHPFTNIL